MVMLKGYLQERLALHWVWETAPSELLRVLLERLLAAVMEQVQEVELEQVQEVESQAAQVL